MTKKSDQIDVNLSGMADRHIDQMMDHLQKQRGSKKAVPFRKCVVCKTKTVVPTMRTEQFTMSTPIGAPLAQYVDGAHCTNCGLRYEF